jgi:hypothetical protein
VIVTPLAALLHPGDVEPATVVARPFDARPPRLPKLAYPVAWCALCDGSGAAERLSPDADSIETYLCPRCNGRGYRPVDAAGLLPLPLPAATPTPVPAAGRAPRREMERVA